MDDPEAEVDQTPASAGEPTTDSARVDWWIKTLIANASALRDAGVSSLAVGTFSATLLPKTPPAPKVEDVKNEEQIPDGLPAHLDPRSYPGGIVPGYQIEKITYDEE